MKLCSRGVVYQLVNGEMRARAVGCGRRDCTECGPGRLRLLRKRMASGNPNKLLTMTLPTGTYDTPQAGIDALHAALRALAKEIRGTHGRLSFEYFAVPEMTKIRTPHLHVLLISPYIDQRWLSKFFEEQGIGSVCDIREIKRLPGAVKYVAKYASKSKDFIDARRSFTASSLYEEPTDRVARWDKQERSTWRYTLDRLPTLADEARLYGATVEWLSDDEFVTSRASRSQAPPIFDG
jgi:hypothetical protein